jgi:hypothetical protein
MTWYDKETTQVQCRLLGIVDLQNGGKGKDMADAIVWMLTKQHGRDLKKLLAAPTLWCGSIMRYSTVLTFAVGVGWLWMIMPHPANTNIRIIPCADHRRQGAGSTFP